MKTQENAQQQSERLLKPVQDLGAANQGIELFSMTHMSSQGNFQSFGRAPIKSPDQDFYSSDPS